jgi:glycosyltransferase involved in cell wall biosynthesis
MNASREAVRAVHVILPDGIDDPAQPSGGNVYDRRVCSGLMRLGWTVIEHQIPGDWPRADPLSLGRLAHALDSVDDGGVVLIDGLIATAAADVLLPRAHQVQQVVLMHMPQGAEDQVVAHARAVIATSHWTRQWLLSAYSLSPQRVHVIEPGVDEADLAEGTAQGRQLLCVAAVMPHKGHDHLVAALSALSEHDWTCTCVGSRDRDPAFVDLLEQQAQAAGISDRIAFVGSRTGAELTRSYASADLLVLASRAETYGMVITEALSRGLPVIATDVGGVSSALGAGPRGDRPGALVPAEDPGSLAVALQQWLDDPGLRRKWRASALDRRMSLSGWDECAGQLAQVLQQVAA